MGDRKRKARESNLALLDEQIDGCLAPNTEKEYRRLMGKVLHSWAAATLDDDDLKALFPDLEDDVRAEIEDIDSDIFFAKETEYIPMFVAWYSRKGDDRELLRSANGQQMMRSAVVWYLKRHGRTLLPETEAKLKSVQTRARSCRFFKCNLTKIHVYVLVYERP
jgi:hypothetical protein